MRRFFLLSLVALTGVMLSGCSSTAGKQSQPVTCLKRVASVEVVITQSYETTLALLEADIIDKAKARDAARIIGSANNAVDSAGRLCQIDEPKASDYLKEAASLIKDVNVLLGGRL